MSLFGASDNRIRLIHENYQKIIEYQNQRIKSLEKFLKKEIGIWPVCPGGDEYDRNKMLFYAKSEGVTHPIFVGRSILSHDST